MNVTAKIFRLVTWGVLLVILRLPVQSQALKNTGLVAGIVRDDANNPLAGVTIVTDKTKKGTSTSVNGEFQLSLGQGTYTLLVSAIGFESKRITDVEVKQGRELTLSIILSEKMSASLQAVVVTATAKQESTRGLLQAQKNNAGMTDGISSEQMGKTADANTAQVLKRVSGITVQSGKFVTIRGVSDRYNNVLINGSALPSTEPNRKNFSFDIIPSALIDNVVVNKTATPDLSGEFTGGIVQINTKDIPAKNFVQVSVGTGINTQSAGKDYISYKRDAKANVGRVDSERMFLKRGGILDPKTYAGYIVANDTSAMQRVGRLIPNRWQMYKYSYLPTQNYQLFAGGMRKIDDSRTVGIIGAVTYRNEMQHEDGDARSWGVNEGASLRQKYLTNLGGQLTLAYRSPAFKLSVKNFYNLSYSNQTDKREVYDYASTSIQVRFSDQTLVNKIFQTRVSGEHVISKTKIKLDWNFDDIVLKRDQPDSRFLTTTITQGGARTFNFSEKNMRWGGVFSSVFEERRQNRGVNVSFPFSIKGQKQHIKAGYAFSRRNSDYYASPIRIIDDSTLNPNGYVSRMQGLPYYQFVNPEAFGSGSLKYYFGYTKTTTGAGASTGSSTGDGYDGEQNLHAGYAMADLRFFKKIRLIGGVRLENNIVDMHTVFYEQETNPPSLKSVDSVKTYREQDVFPSFNLVYSITAKANIRAAFSKTIARPDFVERSPYRYFDFVEQADVYGEKILEVTRVDNYDIRFEYFPTGEEILSGSLFYKKFEKPVEREYDFINPYGIIRYLNLYSAEAYGFEVDLRKSLAFISEKSTILKNLTVYGNFTYLQGKIAYLITRTPGSLVDDTSYISGEKRPIQGLSPYIINGGLTYQTPKWTASISFNRTGPRIISGGMAAPLVQYEQARNVLDIQLGSKFFSDKLEVKLNITDLLNEPFIIYSNSIKNGISPSGSPTEPVGELNEDPKGVRFNNQYDFINYKVNKGTGFSIGLSYKL